MWATLAVACALIAALGYLLARSAHVQGLYAEAFAAGAVLTTLANSMMPEAFEHGGRRIGPYAVLGYIVAAILTIAE